MAVRGITPSACTAMERQEGERPPVWWLEYLIAVSVTCFCRASLCWRRIFISSLRVLISSLCLFSTVLILPWVSCSSACSFSVMFCKQKWGANYWDLPSGSAFSSSCLKITFIQPLLSAFLPSPASTVTLPSCHWSLELTRLCPFSACNSPCLLSPRTHVLCPFYCSSLSYLALSASLSAYSQLPAACSFSLPY